MRKKIVAGNWKMNLTKREALALYAEITNGSNAINAYKLAVFSPFLFLDALKQNEQETVQIGAQNFYFQNAGAFTGEVSYSQLKDLGVTNVLIGHSERRMIFNETDEIIKQKVDVAIANEMNAFFCCGEPLEVREENTHFDYVFEQLKNNIFHLSAVDIQKLVIAYEPIWAIGTGKTATAQQAEEMHAHIRNEIAKKYDASVANAISILYGGSCNASNAKELFANPNVDGGLIGGASLKSKDFLEIAKSF
ncbi:MAG TPA: triose-phosphate isomerase [Crocinitomicaceae bacterium]|nr:triose-phosphate isomerase [Crocinitomicaceae bacterium]